MKRALITVSVLTTTLLVSYSAAQALNRGRLTQEVVPPSTVKYRTMLDMTFPEFEAAAKKTDIVLVPTGAIEEHSSHLPLGTDAMNATAQVFHVQQYLRTVGVETIVGPPLNIGITNEASDWARDGTYAYPGSLTISKSTFVALYVDVLRSLRDNGLRRAFLYIGHLGTRHVEAVVEVVQEANRRIDGMIVYATIDSEMLERMKLAPSSHILSVEKGRNFEMVAQLLGQGTELPRTTHADGAETSWTLYFYPHVVRPGYERFPNHGRPAFSRSYPPATEPRIRAVAADFRSTRRRLKSGSRSSTTRPPVSARPSCRCCERSEMAGRPVPSRSPGGAASRPRPPVLVGGLRNQFTRGLSLSQTSKSERHAGAAVVLLL